MNNTHTSNYLPLTTFLSYHSSLKVSLISLNRVGYSIHCRFMKKLAPIWGRLPRRRSLPDLLLANKQVVLLHRRLSEIEDLKLNNEDATSINDENSSISPMFTMSSKVREKIYSSPTTSTKNSLNNNNLTTIAPQKETTIVSNISNEEVSSVKYLPLPFPEKNLISGLMPLSKAQRQALISNSPLGKAMRIYVTNIITNIVYNHTSCDELKAIENCFSAPIELYNPQSLNKSDLREFYGLMSKHIMPLTQSLCVYLFENTPFTFEQLNDIASKYEINCDSFKEEKIKKSNFIELFFAIKLKLVFEQFTSFKGRYHLINLSGFRNMDAYFNELGSIDRTGQRHCDLLITRNNSEKYYIDFKTYTGFSPEHCRFSLFHADKASLLLFINDMSLMVSNYRMKYNIKPSEKVSQLENRLSMIKAQPINNANIEEVENKFYQMLQIVVNAFFDPELQELKVSFAKPLNKDLSYIIFHNNVVVPCLNNIKDDLDFINFINTLFPEKNIINEEQHRQAIEEMLDKYLPAELKEQAKEIFTHVYQLK